MKFECGEQFRQWPHKAITLLGMSGVGKSTLAKKLPRERWFHYSGDYRIGTRYLREPILDNLKRCAMQNPFLAALLRSDSIYIGMNLTIDNLAPISSFLGKLGDPRRGGLALDEFLRRQNLHRDAEIRAMLDVGHFIHRAQDLYGYAHFINDAGGSVAELDDGPMWQHLIDHTVIVYLDTSPEMETLIVERAIAHPKPLYFREDFLRNCLPRYLTALPREETPFGIDLRSQSSPTSHEIDPDHFARWIFPELFAHRLPRYRALARQHGYTVSCQQMASISTERDFIDLIAAAIDRS